MKIAETENLTKIYGSGEIQVKALDGVSIHVDTGEFVVVTNQETPLTPDMVSTGWR